MPESMPYPGSPSLSPEAREKVLQTFRHTLNLAQSGRNEEALLGCDFILKMDARFAPARRLLDALRGIASGTVVDLTGFQAFAAASPAPAAPAAPAAAAPVAPAPAAPARVAAAPAAPAPAPAPAAPAGLDDLSLDDLGPAPASFPAPGAGPAPAPPSFAMPPAGPSFSMDE